MDITSDKMPLSARDYSHKPGLLLGALIGLILIVPVVAIFFLGDALLGLPFVPFDVFDWIARVLPGEVITFGIDIIVKTIRTFNLGETSSTAKIAEHLMAIAGLIGTGVVAAAVFFFVQNRVQRRNDGALPGLILGLAVGIPVMLISNSVNFTSTVEPPLRSVWILVVFLGWGAACNLIYNDLEAMKAKNDPEASVMALDRRSFLLRVGGAAATITVVGAGLGALLRPNPEPNGEAIAGASLDTDQVGVRPEELPNANDPVEPAPGTRAEYTPVNQHYRIDISSRPPLIDAETYMLPIKGLVDTPLNLTLDDIRNNYEPMDQFVTLQCISNPLGGDLISTTQWTGVSFQKILADAGLQADAAYLRIYSADGFDETVSIDLINQDERIMLAYAWDRAPLTQDHGFPLRIYIPDRYGMKQPKWIINIEVVANDEDGYWVRRGWDEIAQMRTTSVVDTVATDAIIRRDSKFFVPIGGIAHAGAREISKVEVKVDEGEWVEAELRAPLSATSWRIWRYDWPFEEGNHEFSVRAYAGNGILQIEEFEGARPSGATGIDSMNASL
jgi:DMSO/TMAO reductase YedYZ molybdopterin-dependent catalytic subunit